MSESNLFKNNVLKAVLELKKDRDVFALAEFDPNSFSSLLEKYEKYGGSLPIFDYWHDKLSQLNEKAELIEARQSQLVDSIQQGLKSFISASSEAAIEIMGRVSNLKHLKVNQIRANINVLKASVQLMVLYKPDWQPYLAPTEDQELELSTFEDALFEVEETLKRECEFKIDDQSFPYSISTEVHWLVMDERLNISSLTTDYPISVRK